MPREKSFGLALVMVATATAHLSALQGELLGWDDRRALLGYRQWRGLGWDNLSWDFSTLAMGIYRPITWLSYGLDFIIGRLDPWIFHLSNLLVHVAVAGALYVALERWMKLVAPERAPFWPAVLATLFWAVHPLRVQVVAWVSARADALAALFILLATIAWLRWLAEKSRHARVFWHACFAVSLLCKPALVGAPLAWFLAERWLEARGRLVDRKRSVADLGFGLILAGAGTIVSLIAKQAWNPGAGLPGLPPRAAFLALHNAVFPVWKTVWPSELGIYEPHFPLDVFEPQYVLGALAAVAIAAAAWRRPSARLTMLAYVALMAPVLGIVPFGYEITADRFCYGPALTWSFALSPLLTRKHAPVVGIWLCFMGALSWRQAAHWQNSNAFWRHNYELDPRSAIASSGMGDAMLQQDRIEEARVYYERALQLQPAYEPTLLGLGFIDLVQGRPQAAIDKLEVYLASHPESQGAQRFIMEAYRAVGRVRDAEAVRIMLEDERALDRESLEPR